MKRWFVVGLLLAVLAGQAEAKRPHSHAHGHNAHYQARHAHV